MVKKDVVVVCLRNNLVWRKHAMRIEVRPIVDTNIIGHMDTTDIIKFASKNSKRTKSMYI